MRRTLLSSCLSVLLLTLLAPRLARAEDVSNETSATRRPGALLDRSHQTRNPMLSFFIGAPFYDFGGAFGVRYTVPVADDGFIDELNDSVELEFGADFHYALSNRFGFGVPAEGRWTFHITDRFSAYAKAGLGFAMGFSPIYGVPAYGYLYPIFGPGVLYRLTNSNIYLRGEIGTHGGKIGIGIGL